MKILFAADGSKYTKKALAFLVTHDSLAGPDGEVVVLNVQAPVPGRVKTMLGSAEVAAYHAEESQKVLAAIERSLQTRPAPAAASPSAPAAGASSPGNGTKP